MENVLSNLSEIPLDLPIYGLPKTLIGVHETKGEMLIRQILLKNYYKMASKLIQCIGNGRSFVGPLPTSWINSLQSSGVNVDPYKSKLSLYQYSIFCLGKGVVKSILMFLRFKRQNEYNKPYVVFLNLSKYNIPQIASNKSYDIVTWYKESIVFDSSVEEIWAQVVDSESTSATKNLILCKSIFPKLKGPYQYALFLLKTVFAFMVALFGIIRGKWWYGLLYDESVYANYICLVERESLAREYLFHNSYWLHKPLWVYEVEKRGSMGTLYFYSTNVEPIEYGGHKRAITHGMKIMQWEKYWVWDDQQKEYLQGLGHNKEYCVVGPIDFSDNGKTIIDNSDIFKIAVFDITPKRPTDHTKFGWAEPPYYSDKLMIQFLSDIGTVFANKSVQLMYKEKRTVDQVIFSKGTRKSRNIILKDYYKMVDPGISAKRLIEHCDAVISMPFTATSLIGINLGKPTAFYDPSATIHRNKSHEISVIKTFDQLKSWCDLLQKHHFTNE